ncbi:Sec-independent protein translocase subunit TatA [Endothiovibrio diazotrophicus]
MGVGGIGIWQLLIILAIVLVIFGAKRLRNVGADLGAAVKGFKGAMREGDAEQGAQKLESKEGTTIEGEATKEKEKEKA